MALTSFDQFVSAYKQRLQFNKQVSRVSIAAMWFCIYDLAGNPGAGTLSLGSNTTAGLMPVGIQPIVLTSVANASAGSTVYTGTVPFGTNFLAGANLTVINFGTGANNGTFLCSANTQTTLTLSNASGVAETHAALVLGTNGIPPINTFGTNNTGYLSRVEFGNSMACRYLVYDRLFNAGAYNFNSAVTLSAQPSYTSRLPLNSSGSPDFSGTEIWVETITAFTGNMSIAVTYTDQSGTTGVTTGTIATGVAPTIGRMIQLPLAAGDSGVQKIESVTATVASAGTFNIVVVRPLVTCRVRVNNDGGIFGPELTGLPQIFATSALCVAVSPDSTATGIPELTIEVMNT